MEIRYGLLQVAEALYYLHTTERLLHLNVCPQNVIVTKRGMWKLTGLCFMQSIGSEAQSKVGDTPLCFTAFGVTNPYARTPSGDINAAVSDSFSEAIKLSVPSVVLLQVLEYSRVL